LDVRANLEFISEIAFLNTRFGRKDSVFGWKLFLEIWEHSKQRL